MLLSNCLTDIRHGCWGCTYVAFFKKVCNILTQPQFSMITKEIKAISLLELPVSSWISSTKLNRSATQLVCNYVINAYNMQYSSNVCCVSYMRVCEDTCWSYVVRVQYCKDHRKKQNVLLRDIYKSVFRKDLVDWLRFLSFLMRVVFWSNHFYVPVCFGQMK